MEPPTNDAKLKQCFCEMQWMQSATPNFSSIIRPLSTALERVYGISVKRTTCAASRVDLMTIGSKQAEIGSFDSCKQAWKIQVTISHLFDGTRLFF